MEGNGGYVELMAETCASRREYIRVNGEDVPIELVRKRFLKLDGEHIRYVMDSLRQNTTQVVNIRAYTLAQLNIQRNGGKSAWTRKSTS